MEKINFQDNITKANADGSSAYTTDNSSCIPIYIIGYKTRLFEGE